MNELSALYQTDYSAWAQRHAELLRAGRFAELDLEHLLEELSDTSKIERRELESRLLILLAHLLKWQYHLLPERWRVFRGDSWRTTIIEQRTRLAKLLKQSPGLKTLLPATITESYADAVQLASDETGLPPDTFPGHCPYAFEQLLDKAFYPQSRVP